MVESCRVDIDNSCVACVAHLKDSDMDFLGHLAAGMGAEAESGSILVLMFTCLDMILICLFDVI